MTMNMLLFFFFLLLASTMHMKLVSLVLKLAETPMAVAGNIPTITTHTHTHILIHAYIQTYILHTYIHTHNT